VSQLGNFTWAGQTLGGVFESDGRLQGTLDIQTIQCDQNANTCLIPVPAPSVALVFLSSTALSESDSGQTKTFPTTALTKTAKTVAIDPSVLATSNGHSGMGEWLGSTSKGSVGGALGMAQAMPGIVVLVAAAVGAVVLGRNLVGGWVGVDM